MKPSPGPWKWGNEVPSGDQSILDAKGMRVIDAVNEGPVCCENPDDGILLALAPEMREMLLSLEWQRDESVRYCCVCNAMKEDHSRSKKPLVHLASCELGALLEKLR